MTTSTQKIAAPQEERVDAGRPKPSVRLAPWTPQFSVRRSASALLVVSAIVVLFLATIFHLLNPSPPKRFGRTAASDPALVGAGIPPDAAVEDTIVCTCRPGEDCICR